MRRSPSLDDLFLQANNPAEFARSALGFFPDPLQESVLRSRHPRRLLCCSRQWGKSTTAAALAIHRLRFSLPGSTVLLLAPTHRQSAELLARMKSFARRLGLKPRGDGQNEHSLLLPNSSRAIALPGTEHSNRGFSAVSLLIVDEAARIAWEGFKQITLLGQNVNSYRHDGFDFTDLLLSLHEIPGIRRIRYTSPHPSDITPRVMDLYGALPKLCPNLHLPLQAGPSRVFGQETLHELRRSRCLD